MSKNLINLRPQNMQAKYLEIPAGWKLVKGNDKVLSTDMYAHLYKVCWLPIDSKDINLSVKKVADYVIRKTGSKTKKQVRQFHSPAIAVTP